ncbi:WASH complex, subunit CCDC53 [Phytophthora cactorum]|nr:WASH complex, subunit CCDC53 [Phytophthora cactorum]
MDRGLFSPTNADGLGRRCSSRDAHHVALARVARQQAQHGARRRVAREPECGVCTKSFNILRRRHHCRSCHIAWYCMDCLDDDATLEITGSRPTVSKRRSFSSSSSFAREHAASDECECKIYEVEVWLCQLMSPVSVDGVGTEVDRGNRGFRDSLGSNLMEPEDTASVEKKVEVETPETDDDAAAKANEFEELVAQLQAENEKLRNRVEKFKRKVSRRSASTGKGGGTRTCRVGGYSGCSVLPLLLPKQREYRTVSEQQLQHLLYLQRKLRPLAMERVKMKMEASGVDPSILDGPDAIIGELHRAQIVRQQWDDEQYAKFFKLLKMGMPSEQIKLKMSASGLNPDSLIRRMRRCLDSLLGKTQPTRNFKLMKMGMPAEQVKMKMSAAGLNGDLLDTPDAPSPNQKAGTSSGGLLAGLPPPKEAVKVDPSALQASLASKLNTKPAPKKPEEPQLPKKETVKPNVELRPLFWTRVPVNVVSSTVWMKLNDSHAELDVEEMEWMFRKNPVDASKKLDEKKKEAEKVPAQPKEVLLFDPKRQQNVSIAIARFKMSSEDIKNAIYALDGQKLGSEVLNVLISISPTLEEIDMLKNYDGDVKLLGNVEKFFLDLLTIPRYTSFENRILETQAQLDTLVAATDQVTESDKFRRVLEHILAIGNYLNGSTPRGGAYGFKLDTLMKLHTLKSVDPRVTLMHFLLRQLEEKAPDVITFAGEVPHIVEAKRLSLDQLRADLSSYNTELAMLKGQVRASKNDHIEGDKFYEVMTPFAKDAEEVLEELGRDFNGLETSYQELVSSFGEDPRKVGPMEFFTILDEFVTEFKKAYRQNQTKEYQAIYEEAAAARQEEERQQNSQETKAIYAEIMSIITAWAGSIRQGEEAVIEQFKDTSRKLGMDEITADEFCDQQNGLLEAFARFKEQVKKEKESKKQQRNSLVSPPSEGREKQGPLQQVAGSVLAAFGGDPKKMKSFTSHTRKYGNEQITAHEFYQYLMDSFDPDFVGRLVPDLARLLQDSEKRHALISRAV